MAMPPPKEKKEKKRLEIKNFDNDNKKKEITNRI
jgi:hypothetical protein